MGKIGGKCGIVISFLAAFATSTGQLDVKICTVHNVNTIYPIIECMTLVRDCRRYRTVPLEAFVKGHLRVVWKASTKVFDGYEKNIRQKFENL